MAAGCGDWHRRQRRPGGAPPRRSREIWSLTVAELTTEVAIVTGASSGIGAATARELVRRGARVVLAARREDMLHDQQRAIRAAGGEAVSIPTDVSDPEQLSRLVAGAEEAFGRVDVLVNNAGANWRLPLAATTPEDLADLVEVN